MHHLIGRGRIIAIESIGCKLGLITPLLEGSAVASFDDLVNVAVVIDVGGLKELKH